MNIIKNLSKKNLAPILSLFVLALFLFYLLNFVFSAGVCCGDDAQHADIAKNFVYGLGYTTTLQEGETHYQQYKFDPRIGVGPTVIFPASLLIKLFGNTYWAPGLAHVLVVTILLIILGSLLYENEYSLGILLATTFFFVLNSSLLSYHFELWYALLGEVTAALLILIGILLYFWQDSSVFNFFSGLAFSLAVNAKLISFLPFLSFVFTIFIFELLEVKKIGQLDNKRKKVVDFLLIFIGFSLPFILFEAWKLFSLGLKDYIEYWKKYYYYVSGKGVSQIGLRRIFFRIDSRLDKFHDRFSISFISIPLVLYTSWYFLREDDNLRSIYLMIFTIVIIYTAWWFLFSIGWPRYYAIALILIIFVIVLPLLLIERSKLTLIYIIILMIWSIPSMDRLRYPLSRINFNFFEPTRNTKDLIEISKKLSTPEKHIILTSWWATAADIEYMMPAKVNFTSFKDKHLDHNTYYWIAINKKFLSNSDELNKTIGKCKVFREYDRYIVGQCLLKDGK